MPYTPKHKNKLASRILQAALSYSVRTFDRVTLHTDHEKSQHDSTGRFLRAFFQRKSSLYEAATAFATSHAFWATRDEATREQRTHLSRSSCVNLSWSKSDKETPASIGIFSDGRRPHRRKGSQPIKLAFDSLVETNCGGF